MDFLVVFFDFDNVFQAVCNSRIQLENGETEIAKGTKCKVPFETEKIGDDGKETVETELYDGTILCVGQVKKKAEEQAVRSQKQLDDGTPLNVIFEQCSQPNKKRNASTKLAEALKELREIDKPSEKKKEKQQKDKVAGSKRSVSGNGKETTSSGPTKKKKQSVENVDSHGACSKPKSAIHPEKLAEITELLGCMQSTPKKDTSISISPRRSPRAHRSTTDSPVKSVIQPTSLSTPKKIDAVNRKCSPGRSPRAHKSATYSSPAVQLHNQQIYEDISPVKSVNQPKVRISLLPPKKDPGKRTTNAPERSPVHEAAYQGRYEDRWDGLFVNSVNMVNNIYHDMDAQDNYSPLPSSTQTKRQAMCDLLEITAQEADIAAMVLRKMANALDIQAVPDASNTSKLYDSDRNHEPSFNYPSYHCSDVGSIHADETPVEKKSDETPVEEKSDETPVEEKPDDKQLTMLIQDSLDPNKYKDVLVVKTDERKARMHSKSAKKPAVALLNSILSCVFTKKELGESSGLGLRNKPSKDDTSQSKPLDPTKVEAIREYVLYHCAREGWPIPSKVEFNTTVTNKVTNCRRKLLKHPLLKKKST